MPWMLAGGPHFEHRGCREHITSNSKGPGQQQTVNLICDFPHKAARTQLTPGPIPASLEAAHTTPEHTERHRTLTAWSKMGRVKQASASGSQVLWLDASHLWRTLSVFFHLSVQLVVFALISCQQERALLAQDSTANAQAVPPGRLHSASWHLSWSSVSYGVASPVALRWALPDFATEHWVWRQR